jgi:hypothetical protein
MGSFWTHILSQCICGSPHLWLCPASHRRKVCRHASGFGPRERGNDAPNGQKREAQIQGVIESTVGMYGDLQGIAGRALQEIEGLEVPLLEGGKIEEPVE